MHTKLFGHNELKCDKKYTCTVTHFVKVIVIQFLFLNIYISTEKYPKCFYFTPKSICKETESYLRTFKVLYA